MRITSVNNSYNNSIIKKNKYSSTVKPQFTGKEKEPSKLMLDAAEFMAKHILENEKFQWLVSKTMKSEYLTCHLSALTSVVLSGFYMKKTIDNKNLDPNRKRTLAINQGATWVASTALSYGFSNMINKKTDDFIKKFIKINKELDKTVTAKQIENWKSGIRSASQLMVFGMMFRFVAPVLVTPIANHLGNKLEEKKKLEQQEQQLGRKQNDIKH